MNVVAFHAAEYSFTHERNVCGVVHRDVTRRSMRDTAPAEWQRFSVGKLLSPAGIHASV